MTVSPVKLSSNILEFNYSTIDTFHFKIKKQKNGDIMPSTIPFSRIEMNYSIPSGWRSSDTYFLDVGGYEYPFATVFYGMNENLKNSDSEAVKVQLCNEVFYIEQLYKYISYFEIIGVFRLDIAFDFEMSTKDYEKLIKKGKTKKRKLKSEYYFTDQPKQREAMKIGKTSSVQISLYNKLQDIQTKDKVYILDKYIKSRGRKPRTLRRLEYRTSSRFYSCRNFIPFKHPYVGNYKIIIEQMWAIIKKGNHLFIIDGYDLNFKPPYLFEYENIKCKSYTKDLPLRKIFKICLVNKMYDYINHNNVGDLLYIYNKYKSFFNSKYKKQIPEFVKFLYDVKNNRDICILNKTGFKPYSN
jgi:hypothetical protein